MGLGQKSREHALLNAVEAVLKRINWGRFGQCPKCEQEIYAFDYDLLTRVASSRWTSLRCRMRAEAQRAGFPYG
jgi:hypothetical protein